MTQPTIARRDLLKGSAALVVAVSVPSIASLAGCNSETTVVARTLDPTQLDTWLAIAADETVTAYWGKVDMGQGVDTAIAQIVSLAFDNESDFFGQVPTCAGRFAGLNKLHVDVEATLGRIHALINDVFDQTVSRPFHRHIFGFDALRPIFVLGSKLLGGLECLRIKVSRRVSLRSGTFGVVDKWCFVIHCVPLTAIQAVCNFPGPVPVPWADTQPSSGRSGA